MLDRILVVTVQRKEFGSCPMNADDISCKACGFREVVPDVDIVFVNGRLTPENIFGIVVPCIGVECTSVKNCEGLIVGVYDQPMRK